MKDRPRIQFYEEASREANKQEQKPANKPAQRKTFE